MRKLVITCLLIILGAATFVQPPLAAAQEDPVCYAYYNFDDLADLAWTDEIPTKGSDVNMNPHTVAGVTGNGYTGGSLDAGSYFYNHGGWEVTVDPSWILLQFSFQYKATDTGDDVGSGGHAYHDLYANQLEGTFIASDFSTTWQADTINFTGGVDGYSSLGVIMARSSTTDIEIWFDNIYVEYMSDDCEAGLIRPLSANDEDPDWGLISLPAPPVFAPGTGTYAPGLTSDNDGEDIVQAYSRYPNANVYAATDGEVIGLERLSNACGFFFGCISLSPTSPESIFFDAISLVDRNDLWMVTLDAGDSYFRYIVRDADQYVGWGSTVNGGCILGKTIPIEENVFQHFTQEIALVAKVAIDDNTSQELLPLLVTFPTEEKACNADPRFANCLGTNPQFLQNGDGWVTSGNVTFGQVSSTGSNLSGSGALLAPGAEIYQMVTLDPETEYAVNANAKAAVTSDADVGAIYIYLGSSSTVGIVTSSYQSYILPLDTPEGSLTGGTLFEVGVINPGTVPLAITHLCITSGPPDLAPTTCYFQDPAFALTDTFWTTDGAFDHLLGATWLNLADDQTVSQSATLPAGDYRITAKIAPYWTPGPSPESGAGTLDFEFPSGEGFTTIGGVDMATYQFAPIDVTAEFTLADDEDSDFTFKSVVTDDGGGDFLGVQVYRLCLESEDGPIEGGGGGLGPPFQVDCQVAIPPGSFEAPVQAWLAFQWQALDHFFKCDLMVVLARIWGVANDTFQMLGWAIRSLFAYGQVYNNWLGSEAFPWLGGHLSNIASGTTTTIITESGSCHDVFCVLDNLISSVIGPLIGLLVQVVGAFFTLIFTIITALVGLFTSLIGFFAGLLAAFANSQPVPIPGIPACELDPRSNGICMGLWALENTVFSGPGALAIPLIIGYLSLEMILWAVNVFRSAIQKLGQDV